MGVFITLKVNLCQQKCQCGGEQGNFCEPIVYITTIPTHCCRVLLTQLQQFPDVLSPQKSSNGKLGAASHLYPKPMLPIWHIREFTVMDKQSQLIWWSWYGDPAQASIVLFIAETWRLGPNALISTSQFFKIDEMRQCTPKNIGQTLNGPLNHEK